MDKLSRITKVKFMGLIIYYITLFIPIYSTSFFGVPFKASVVDLNAGVFYVILFFILIFGTMFIKLFIEKYFKIAYFVTLGFMIALQLLILINPDSLTIRFTWFFQILVIAFLFLAYFKGVITLKAIDSIKEFFNRAISYVIEKGYNDTPEIQEREMQMETDTEFNDY